MKSNQKFNCLISFVVAVAFIFILLIPSFADTINHVYDDLNRLIRVEYADGTVTEYEYDEIGNRQVKRNVLPPVVNFSCTPTSGSVPFTVSCTDHSLHNPTSWLWDFGEGPTSAQQNPTHTYTTTGSNTVSLTVTNIAGSDTKTMVNYITVQPCPNLPVRIAGTTPSYYSTLQAAYDAAANGDTIQSLAVNFIDNFNANRDISVTLNGGYGCGYISQIGNTVLQGMVTTSAGTLTIGNFELVTGSTANIYLITATAGIGGGISPSGTVTAAQGAIVTFTITPNTGYQIASVNTSGCLGSLAGNTFTTGAITSNCTITASFASSPTYTVTPVAGANGSISPSTPQIVNSGSTVSFTLTPNTSYHIAGVNTSGCLGSLAGNTFTTGAITANCTVATSFAINTYTISAAAGNNGTITPSGAVTVSYGASQAFTITPNANYHITDVKVDGVSQGAITSYTFTNVTANHTITAIFGVVEPTNLTATAVSSTQVNLSWTDNSNNESGFAIERKTDLAGAYAQIATVPANVTTYSEAGLATNTIYYYRVRAYNAIGYSTYSNVASATTGSACIANGDVNGDGVMDAGDVVVAQRVSLGIVTPTSSQLCLGDVSPAGAPDGVINAADVTVIQRKALGLQ